MNVVEAIFEKIEMLFSAARVKCPYFGGLDCPYLLCTDPLLMDY
jgi:hypothetical protein